LNESVDLVLTITGVTTLLKVDSLLLVASLWAVQLERPHILVDFLEVFSAGINLMNDIFNADDINLAEFACDGTITANRNPLTMNLETTSLVDQMPHSLEVRSSVGYIRLNKPQHFNCGRIEFDKSGVVNLSQSKELQNLSGSWVDTINTSNSDNNSNLCLRFPEESAF